MWTHTQLYRLLAGCWSVSDFLRAQGQLDIKRQYKRGKESSLPFSDIEEEIEPGIYELLQDSLQ